MRPNAVKHALKAGKPALGTWLSLASITAARFMARCGLDWLTVDIEHSLCDWETAAHIFASVADAGCVALARVPANRHDHIKRVLDNGAMGVVVPMVNSRQEAEDAISAMLYPPRGSRSVGGSVHALNFGGTPAEYYARADDELLAVLQCEHIKAVEDADAIFAVQGIDAVFVGPNDLAASMRSPDGKPPSAKATDEALAHILKTCQKHGVAPGYHCMNADEAVHRREQGWKFLAIGSELKFMLNGTAEVLKKVGVARAGEGARY
jgi:4-hydroxy-2-oxoheptanedioate aldolase